MSLGDVLSMIRGVARVSFDLRVLSLRHHDPYWTDQRGRRCTFELGSFYRPAADGGKQVASSCAVPLCCSCDI
eukprot:5667880-Amphidinium_carterae.1